ncbi:MAG: hypothetical protein KJZ74_14870 [Gemmatimonadales bacterium]|nr:hypothetical protein [Gemmatimonadota bacterium]MCL4215185.1 hypothetical protein [Gemmatimonadales bacterium]
MSEAVLARGWIQSPAFDLAAFILVPLSSLIVLGAVLEVPYGMHLVVGATYLVAIPHYLSSLTFFLGDDNLSYYRSRRTAFFVGPVVIVALVAILRLVGLTDIVLNTMFLWNIWHVSLQSAGILSIYRRLNGGPQEERPLAHRTIFLLNATLALWFVDRYPPLHGWLVAIHEGVPMALRYTLLVLGATTALRYARLVARRDRPMPFPEKAFLVSSLVLFTPYLWVRDSNLATFGMLMGHFIQYLSIVWLLHRRKYARAEGSARQRTLGMISARPALLFATIAGSGLAFYAASELSALFGVAMAYVILWNSITLVHFYLDGLIWAFKQPFVRQSIGAYLTPAARVAIR